MQKVEVADLEGVDDEATEEQIVKKLRESHIGEIDGYVDSEGMGQSEIIVIDDDDFMYSRQRRATVVQEEEGEAEIDSMEGEERKKPMGSILQILQEDSEVEGKTQLQRYKEIKDRPRRFTSLDKEAMQKLFDINKIGFVKRKEVL